jgi:hypothetical protein
MLGLSGNYNSVTETLLVKVVSCNLFGCHFSWMYNEEFECWREQNLVSFEHTLGLLRIGGNGSQSWLWIVWHIILLTLDSPFAIHGPVLGLEEVMHLLYHTKESIPPVIRTRMRRFCVQREAHGRHETMAYRCP